MANLKHRGRTVRRAVTLAAAPHRAWQCWAEPARLEEWFCDEATGGALPGDTLKMGFEGFAAPAVYRVERSMPGRELVLSFEAPLGGDGLLEIRFEAEAAGTRVELAMSGLPEDEGFEPMAVAIESGWANALNYQRLYLERYWLKRKSARIAMVSGAFDAGEAMQWLAAGLRRERWLTVPGEELAAAWSEARHVVSAWAAIEGVLELQAFPAGEAGSTVALRAVSWGEGGVGEEVEARLRESVSRLRPLLF